MASRSKRVRAFREKIDRNAFVPIDDALASLKSLSSAKFDESVDVSVNLGVDPRKSDQVVRGSHRGGHDLPRLSNRFFWNGPH